MLASKTTLQIVLFPFDPMLAQRGMHTTSSGHWRALITLNCNRSRVRLDEISQTIE